jgi:hypothetical protein
VGADNKSSGHPRLNYHRLLIIVDALVGAVVGYETFKYDGTSVAGSLKGNGETIGGYFAQRFGARELSRPRRRFGLSDCALTTGETKGATVQFSPVRKKTAPKIGWSLRWVP